MMHQSSARPAPSRSSSPAAPEPARIGLVGGRGHTGAELIRLLDAHPRLSLAFASSRELARKPLRDVAPSVHADLAFIDSTPEAVVHAGADVFILALPNGVSNEYVAAIEAAQPSAVIVDLSADHRFDGDWAYGLPELNRRRLAGARRIANPGCYATAMMLALAPISDQLAGVPHAFGVSGYSGAGTTPSRRNDPQVLRDNLLPYQLADHLHEREVSHQLGLAVRFAPHVAPFFRGLTVTVMAELREEAAGASLIDHYQAFYEPHPLVDLLGEEVPLVRDAAKGIKATIGGITVSAADPRRVSIVATLDNLLKGAASQAVQNINLACGFGALEGLSP